MTTQLNLRPALLERIGGRAERFGRGVGGDKLGDAGVVELAHAITTRSTSPSLMLLE